MKTFLITLAAVTGGFAFWLAQAKRKDATNVASKAARNLINGKSPVVNDLAHKLQDAWADHHTVA